LAALNKIMETNRKENEKLFNANTPKIAPVDDSDTIIVDVGARQVRLQSQGPLHPLKVKRTRSASPLKSMPRKAHAEYQPFGKSNLSKDNIPTPAGTSPARVPTAQMHSLPEPKDSTTILADAVAAAAAGQALEGHSLREHCNNIQEVLKHFMNQGLSQLAGPDQQTLTEDLKIVFTTTMRHLEADIDWAFKKNGTGRA
jgi:hypothetical protein